MKQKLILFSIILSFFAVSNPSYAGFNFCPDNNGNEGGNGTFQQQIPLNGIVEVGELPAGISGIAINLKSTVDIDIQLYDKATGEKLTHWPDGILAGSGYQSTEYLGNLIEWSGYNGDGTGPGNEYIKLSNADDAATPTNRTFIMKVFGYKAGLADVNYSWKGSNCDASDGGNGSFQQQIVQNSTVNVGDIPVNINNLRIDLTSDEDVDIQLYDAETGKAIVAWPGGILKSGSTGSTTYENMAIEWSGYNGVAGKPGNEYIEISGLTTKKLTMKAFGYRPGFATVTYSWGSKDESVNSNAAEDTTTENGSLSNAEAQMKTQLLNLINQARSQGRNCGTSFYPAVNPVTWNNQLYQASLSHSKDMATNDFFNHTGSDGNNAGFRITSAGYSWSTYGENIAAGYATADSVIQGWLDSPGHCKNMMHQAMTHVAVAKASGGTYGNYWTQAFASPK